MFLRKVLRHRSPAESAQGEGMSENFEHFQMFSTFAQSQISAVCLDACASHIFFVGNSFRMQLNTVKNLKMFNIPQFFLFLCEPFPKLSDFNMNPLLVFGLFHLKLNGEYCEFYQRCSHILIWI